MDRDSSRGGRVFHWLQRRMLWLLLATYAIGARAPSFGRGIRGVRIGSFRAAGETIEVTLPMLMLGFLLIVLFSPDGVLGLWQRWRARQRSAPARQGGH